MQIIERRDLPGGLVRERLRLPGFDMDEAVPAIAIHPASGGPFPVCIVLHCFRGAKENLEPWCRDLAGRGIFAIAIDAHLHGERSIASVFHDNKIASLGEEYSIWVHQTSIAHTAKDVSVILDALAFRPDVDVSRVAATGFSMGGSTALVLAWREPRVRVVASIVGAVNFWWDVTKTRPGLEQEARKASYGPRLRELVASIDPRTRFDRIPPKALFIASGGRDEYIDIESVRRFVADIEPLYKGNRGRLRFHTVPRGGTRGHRGHVEGGPGVDRAGPGKASAGHQVMASADKMASVGNVPNCTLFATYERNGQKVLPVSCHPDSFQVGLPC